MDQRLDKILTTAKWKELTPGLLYYADSLIRNCPWRGLPVTSAPGGKLCVDGFGADDVLQLAVERFLNGQRTYDHSVPLEYNLKRAIRSIIWSANKSCRRSRVSELTVDDDDVGDPMDTLEGNDPRPDMVAVRVEQIEIEKRKLTQFEETLSGDSELRQVVEAYKDGKFKPRDVEKYTGISAARVSELKRKLRQRMNSFETASARRG